MDAQHKRDVPADMLEWIQNHMGHVWDHTSEDIPHTHDICVDTCVQQMRRDGAKCAWAGQVSQHAHKLVMEVTGLGPAAARTVAIQIQTHVTDTAVEIHKRARQTVRPAAPKPPAPSLYTNKKRN